MEIFAWRKFLPSAFIGEIINHANFLSCVNEDMATSTALAKVAGLGEILSSKNFYVYSMCFFLPRLIVALMQLQSLHRDSD